MCIRDRAKRAPATTTADRAMRYEPLCMPQKPSSIDAAASSADLISSLVGDGVSLAGFLDEADSRREEASEDDL